MITTFLVLYSYCWIEVGRTVDTGIGEARQEKTLGLTATTSAEEAHNIADLYLEAMRDYSLKAGLIPIEGEANPFGLLGDTLLVEDETASLIRERVLGITWSEDDSTGNWEFALDLRNVRLAAFERWQRAIAKVSEGTLDGGSILARPVNWQEPYYG